MKTLLSFVIPCYRSELTIEKVINEIIDTVLQREDNYDYEIICVNDCSPDNVLSVLKKMALENRKIKIIDFAKNRGKHAADMAGFANSSGKYVIALDDDFQCPTYELWRLLAPLEADECDMVTARYPQKQESLFKRFGSLINQKMSEVLLDIPENIRLENFGAFKRYVIDEIVRCDNPFPYVNGLICRTTNRILSVEMEERKRGDNKESGFSMRKSISLLLNGFTAFSVKPLRLSSIIGMILALIGFVLGLVIVIRKLIDPDILAGYTSMMAIQLFVSGIILMVLGLIGEYLGRIYICINKSPQYVIREYINFSDKTRIPEIKEEIKQ